jgi:hypothetical protein
MRKIHEIQRLLLGYLFGPILIALTLVLVAPAELAAFRQFTVTNDKGGGIEFNFVEPEDGVLLYISSESTLSEAQEASLRRAAQYWVELLMADVTTLMDINLYSRIEGGNTLGYASPYATGNSVSGYQFPMALIQNGTNTTWHPYGYVAFYNFSDIYELQTNLPHGASYESLFIHELGHVFGINSIDTPNSYIIQQQQIGDRWYFNGPTATEVYNDGSGTALMPLDNDNNPDELGARAHIGVFGSIMGYGMFQNYPMLIEVELAALKDIGYDLDLKKFFGRSLYTGGTESNRRIVTNEDPFFARSQNDYLLDQPNYSTYGVGLHVFGDYNDVTQKANILADGVAAAGVRIDGIYNNLRINPSVTVTAKGERGTAVLLAFGTGHNVIHQGTIAASGLNGVGLRFDFGMTGGSAVVNTGSYTWATDVAYSYYGVNILNDSEQFKQAKTILLKGALADTVSVTGSIAGGTGDFGAAIYIGPGAHVSTIDIMRPYDGSTPTITGDIISDYDIAAGERTTVLNLGLVSGSDGKSTGDADDLFDLVLTGQILGYDAPWSSTSSLYQKSQADTFLGRGLIDLYVIGGKTTVSNDVWVNKLAIGANGTLIVKDEGCI